MASKIAKNGKIKDEKSKEEEQNRVSLLLLQQRSETGAKKELRGLKKGKKEAKKPVGAKTCKRAIEILVKDKEFLLAADIAYSELGDKDLTIKLLVLGNYFLQAMAVAIENNQKARAVGIARNYALEFVKSEHGQRKDAQEIARKHAMAFASQHSYYDAVVLAFFGFKDEPIRLRLIGEEAIEYYKNKHEYSELPLISSLMGDDEDTRAYDIITHYWYAGVPAYAKRSLDAAGLWKRP